MKHIISPCLCTFFLVAHLASAAVPLRWTVETSAANPATFDQFAGATYDLEAALQSRGKPLSVTGDPQLFWQTNGMGSAWWTAPATVSGNVLRATWTPSCDVGAKVYNCFIGITGTVYNAAFQLRLRPSPGAVPNELPLPQRVIDFSRVTVLDPPWPEGAVRPLPKYLHTLDFDDSYTDDAAWYYAQPHDYGSCSAVRDGGFLCRNYDWKFDEAAEFVVRMSAGPGRFASVGVANCGTNLAESIVASGKPSRYFKCLPGRTVDGVNANGVCAEVNVVDGDPQWRSGILSASDIHPLAAVRWVLDNATSAGMAAGNLAARIVFPTGWTQNFHWMIADETSTYIVENGACSNVTGRAVMTNFPLLPTPTYGPGWERYNLLQDSFANITNAWFTRAYSPETEWVSEFHGTTEMDGAKEFWNNGKGKESHRGQHDGDNWWWQTVHTSTYDLKNRTLRICVQEQDDWYVFQVPSSVGGSGGTNTNDVKAIVDAEVGGTNDLKAAIASIPKKTSDLENDSGYITNSQISPGYAPGTARTAMYAWDDDDEVRGWDELVKRHQDHYTPSAHDHTFSNAVISATGDRLLTPEQSAALDVLPGEVDEALSAANEANVWSMATYNFMTGGRTNCWFSGTNYVFGADAATRQHFAWEDGMDAATVPCSMALWEIRDGARQLVWDQRDWTAWYWSFKAAQMTADIQGRIDALGNAVTNDANYAWAKRYASDGTPNPDASTTFIDTPSVTLSPGMKWETIATVSGAAYWTIVGNGAVIGGSGTNATLRIQDFEGNDIMTITKGEHSLKWLEASDFAGNMVDENGWVCFDIFADESADPVGYFSTTLYSSDFLPQTDQNSPAQYSWENLHNGKWRIHYILKPGIQATACFLKVLVEVEGQTVIRYNAGQDISGGLIYNGVKIAPDVSGSPAVGTVIQWKVVR